MPSANSATNHRPMMGPNSTPSPPLPRYCTLHDATLTTPQHHHIVIITTATTTTTNNNNDIDIDEATTNNNIKTGRGSTHRKRITAMTSVIGTTALLTESPATSRP